MTDFSKIQLVTSFNYKKCKYEKKEEGSITVSPQLNYVKECPSLDNYQALVHSQLQLITFFKDHSDKINTKLKNIGAVCIDPETLVQNLKKIDDVRTLKINLDKDDNIIEEGSHTKSIVITMYDTDQDGRINKIHVKTNDFDRDVNFTTGTDSNAFEDFIMSVIATSVSACVNQEQK